MAPVSRAVISSGDDAMPLRGREKTRLSNEADAMSTEARGTDDNRRAAAPFHPFGSCIGERIMSMMDVQSMLLEKRRCRPICRLCGVLAPLRPDTAL